MSLNHLEYIEEYANLIIEVGVNIQKKSKLLISCNFDSYEFARLLGKKAYEKGASLVKIDLTDNHLTKAKILNNDDTSLTYIPPYLSSFNQAIIEEKWSRIRIDNTSEIGVLKGINSEKLQSFEKAWSEASQNLQKAFMSNHMSWCVVCFPDPYWASSLLGKEPSLETQKELWEILIPLLRLDQKDVIKAWQDQADKLRKRYTFLNSLEGKEVHFLDSKTGTDLKIGLCEKALWLGGKEETQDGIPFLANIPTEEVFTAPHKQKAEGLVYTTRPVKIMEEQIEGVWFEFKEGKVVNWGCKNNPELLEKFLSMDLNASHLGEVALVDKSSPIYQSSRVFSNILLDENATCHIALGAAYPICSDKGENLSQKELEERGLNSSLVHKDFMIGSDNLEVKILDNKGNWHSIIQKGEFVI